MVSSHRERRAASWGDTRNITEFRVLKQENRSPKLVCSVVSTEGQCVQNHRCKQMVAENN